MSEPRKAPAVRWATPVDARAIARVHVASWQATYRGLIPDTVLDSLSVEGREQDWIRWLAEDGERRETLIAERDGQVQAFCTLELPSRDAGEADVAGVPALYAHPDAIGHGLGSTLMKAALDAARERGYSKAVLWVLDGNERAAAFYEKHGWKRDGTVRPVEGWPGMDGMPADARPTESRFRR